MNKIIRSLFSIALLTALSGCGTSGAFRANQVTNVQLSQANFNIVARDVQGTAMQGYLIGISVPQGGDVGTFALVRVSGVKKLFDAAVKDLWKNYREKYGDPEGKKLALVNVRQDTETLNTLVYTQAKIFITADVVEFVE